MRCENFSQFGKKFPVSIKLIRYLQKNFFVDKRLYHGYTLYMKTAISLSDTLFQKAEETAQYMGISRSKLFVKALEEYIIKHNGEMITKKLNEVYERLDENEFEQELDIGIESLRELTKNDTW